MAGDLAASIIDVGGGESTLVDDLIGRGYRKVTVRVQDGKPRHRGTVHLISASQSTRFTVL